MKAEEDERVDKCK